MTEHTITAENRENLTVTAVTDVKSFDSENIFIVLHEGGLTVRGSGLKIVQLDLETGQVVINGTVDAFEYTEAAHNRQNAGFIKRLLK